ncbi:hypothetical protein EV652_101354 [Kribbella steppae]|uniref:Uncharacterized protein n=1 Tax=Kribbella steppae TaxID=2512223 RepID=A0A4R2HVL0_9ACTN|nr:hypothetical protein EV652_101354 [Kribbella steppae]
MALVPGSVAAAESRRCCVRACHSAQLLGQGRSSWRCWSRWNRAVPVRAGSDRCCRPAVERAGAAAAAAVCRAPAPAGSAVRRYSLDRTDSADLAAGEGLPASAVAAAAGTGSAPGTDRTATRHHEPAPAHHDPAHHVPAHHDRAHHDRAHHDSALHDSALHDPALHDPVLCARTRRSTPTAAARRTCGPAAARRTDEAEAAAGRRTAAAVVAARAVAGAMPAGTEASGRTAVGAPGRVRRTWGRSATTATGRVRGRCRGPARCRRRTPSGGAPRLSGSSVRSRTARAARRRPGYRPTGSCQPCLHRPTVAEGERYRLRLSDRSHRRRAGRSGP